MTDLLAVGAHADDAELGAGGIIATAALTGGQVAIIDVTDGALATGVSAVERKRQAWVAAVQLGVGLRENMGLPDRNVTSDDKTIGLCVEILRRLQPRVVLLPDWTDRHPDHVATYHLWREALFSSGLGKFGTGEPFRPHRVFTYGVSPGLEPAVLIDVSASYDRKGRALDAYSRLTGGSAFSDTRSGSRALVETRDRHYGQLIGVEYAEAVRPIGPLILNSLG